MVKVTETIRRRFVGGPFDGQSMSVDAAALEVFVAEPPEPAIYAPNGSMSESVAIPKTARYERRRVWFSTPHSPTGRRIDWSPDLYFSA